MVVWVMLRRALQRQQTGNEEGICWHGGGGQPSVKKGTEGIIAPNSHILPDTPPGRWWETYDTDFCGCVSHSPSHRCPQGRHSLLP